MFNSPVLDLVILLSFTYFIGSLILSAINEALAGTLKLRQKDLSRGIYQFFLSSSWRHFVKNRFFESPSIQTLMREKGRLPAYIPARNFVLAIMEHLDPTAYVDSRIIPLDKTKKPAQEIVNNDNREFQGAVLPKDMITVLQTIMTQANSFKEEDRAKEFEARLEEFYNLTMDRVTGWYKRRVRRILLVLGFVLAIVLNIDTIKVVNDAMADRGKLSKAVDNIAANLKDYEALKGKAIVVNDTAGTIKYGESLNNADSLILKYQKDTGYSIGYKDWDDFAAQWKADFLKKLLGVLLTAFALQLGSNYWFDLMNKAVNVRAAGRKPDEVRPDSKSTKK